MLRHPGWLFAMLVLALASCASSDRQRDPIADQWRDDAFGVSPSADVSPAEADSAARSGVLANVPNDPTRSVAVIATARAPLFERPTTASRLLGWIVQGGEVKVVERLMWYRPPGSMFGNPWGGRNGLLPMWAKVDARGVVGFVPCRCLCNPERLKDPRAVEQAVASMASGAAPRERIESSSRKNFSEKRPRDKTSGFARSNNGTAGGDGSNGPPDYARIDEHLSSWQVLPSPSGPEHGLVAIDFERPTPAEEFFIGRLQAARLLAGHSALGPHHALACRVREIGDRIARHSARPRPYGDWVWIVVDRPDREIIALPGGLVVIARGLIEELEHDEHLAAVLAREVAHVEQGHPMERILQARRAREVQGSVEDARNLSQATAGMLMLMAVLQANDSADAASAVANSASTLEDLDAAFGTLDSLVASANDPYAEGQPIRLAYQQVADARAIMLLSAAGWPPEALREAVDLLDVADPGTASDEAGHRRTERIDRLIEAHRSHFLRDALPDPPVGAEAGRSDAGGAVATPD
jgi:hypothetical protein